MPAARSRSLPGAARRLALVALLAAQSHPSLAASALDRARALQVEGRYREALAAYREVLAGLGDSDPAAAASAYNNSCLIRMGLGEHRAALEDCQEALRLRRLAGDRRRLARTLNNLGLALQNAGDFTAAEERFGEALAINREIGETGSAAQNLANLAGLAIREGGYAEALERIAEGIRLARENAGEDWAETQMRVALINRGVVLEKLGAPREALESYREVLAEAGELDAPLRALAQTNMGVMYRNLGDPIRALELFAEAAAIYERLGDLSGQSNVRLNMALARHLNLRRLGEAEADYRRALELARRGGDRPEEIQDLFYLGRLLLERRRWSEAEEVFERCLTVARESGSAEGRWSALAGLGRAAAARGDLAAAVRLLERAMVAIEKVRADLAPGGYRAGFFGDKRFVYAAAVQARAALASAEPGGGHAAAALHVVQRAKERELLDALGGGSPAGPAPPGTLAAPPAGEAMLELFVAERNLFAWRIGKRGIEMRDLGSAQPILDDAAAVHRALRRGQAPDGGALDRLAERLLGGGGGFLAGAKVLRVASDGGLRYLPFELLPVPGAAGERLLDRVAVSYLPSLSSLGPLGVRPGAAGLPILGFGSPLLPAPQAQPAAAMLTSRFELEPLPASERELDSLGRWLGGETRVFRGERASEESFRRAAGEGARVLHLATHAVIDERPGRGAAIVLSPAGDDDGLLFPREIAALDLRADLAVLAACRTAVAAGDTSDALGTLTGAFLAAGAGGVVATLWDVGDRAAAAFVSQLYWQLGRGVAPAEALRRAKLKMRADGEWGRPHLWAGYVLVGDPPAVAEPAPRVPRWAWGLAAILAAAAGLQLWRGRRPAAG